MSEGDMREGGGGERKGLSSIPQITNREREKRRTLSLFFFGTPFCPLVLVSEGGRREVPFFRHFPHILHGKKPIHIFYNLLGYDTTSSSYKYYFPPSRKMGKSSRGEM